MSKIKKFLIVILIIIIAIIIAIMYMYQKSIYTLDDICQMLNSAKFSGDLYQMLNSEEIPKNFKVTTYTDYTDLTNTTYSTYTTYVYVLNNTVYINAESYEYLINYKDSSLIQFDHLNKNIFEYSSMPQYQNLIMSYGAGLKSSFLSKVEWSGINDIINPYKYCGKETIKDKECIKVAMTDKSSDIITIDYYYIDLKTNLIVKCESFRGSSKKYLKNDSTTIIDYDFNSVTESDILQFDINNYPDYEYYNDF